MKSEKSRYNWLDNKKLLIIFGLTIVLIILMVFFLQNKNYKIEDIRKSVVKINVYDKNGNIIQTGSGFIVFEKNILVTNAHVITGGDSADAISEDNKKLEINGAIYYDQDEDIAILEINNNNIKPLNISTKYDVGNKVIAIGSPLGIKNSVSDGIISNILEDGTIQHTAPISYGSSGGALFNSKGRIIGMNTAMIMDAQNINLSIPIQKIRNVYNLNKDNNIKTIKEIQYLNEDIRSIMLNSKAGKKMLELINKLNVSERKIYVNDIKDYKKTYGKNYYLYKIAENNIVSDWVNVSIYNTFDENDKLVESKLPFLKIFKINSTSDETISLIQKYLKDDINKEYSNLLKSPMYEELRGDNNGPLNLGDVNTARLSNDYINAYAYPLISNYNNYVYAIVSKDKNIIIEIEELIKQLP